MEEWLDEVACFRPIGGLVTTTLDASGHSVK